MSGGRGNTTSPELRLLKNDKAHAHRNKDEATEVASSDKLPVAPKTLSERGKEIFYEIANTIEEMYPSSVLDTCALTLYAQNQDQLEYLERILRIQGVTYELYDKKTGNVIFKPRPEVAMFEKCKTYAKNMLAEFGLTPNSRKKMNIKKKETVKENPFAKLG